MKKLVLASGNPGKLEELRDMFVDTGIQLIAQPELGVTDADETGLTFIENAIIKARHAAQHTGLPALADDSGICVTALNGAPGLYSARYAGEHGNVQANIDKLLHDMQDIPDGKRNAHFYCVLALIRHPQDPQPLIVEAQWQGEILRQRQGIGGHGYDPIFWDPQHQQSAAQMPMPLKNKLSHRGQALVLLNQRLPQWL